MGEDISTQEGVVQEVVVNFEHGLHGRPAARLVQTASGFQGEILIRARGREVNGKSILGLLTLGVTHGEHLTIETKGLDASDAMDAVVALFDAS